MIFSNYDKEPKWYCELFFHPLTWSLPLQVVFRWDDIYAVSIFCITLQFTKNEFYAE